MKTFLLTTLFLIRISVFSQTAITYDEVVELEGVTKDELFNRGNHWMINVFRNPDKAIQLKDKEGGQIVGKGDFSYMQSKKSWSGWITTQGVVNFTVKLFFKDGRYRYVLTDFIHEADNSFGLITDAEDCGCKFPLANKKWKGLIWNDIKDQIKSQSEAIASSLKESMKKNVGGEGEW